MSEEVQERKSLSPKTKKILNIVVDVVVAIVLFFALFLAIFSIRSKAKGYSGYTEIFGTAYVAVASNSMEGEKPSYVPEGKLEGFAKGDLIKIKVIDKDSARKLEVGDIVSFETSAIIEGKRVLNTHRIIEINNGEQGNATSYITHGDNNPKGSNETVSINDIVGVYEGKASGIGHIMLFMGSATGFFVCIVLPTLLIVVYCAVNLFLVIRKEKKVQTADAAAEKEAEKERLRQEILAEQEAEKERMRQEILAEMQGNASAPAPQAESQPAEEQPSQPEAAEQKDKSEKDE